jgi:hypothetical protein
MQEVKVLYDERSSDPRWPESCGRSRKGPDEALTGGRRAGLLSREKVMEIRRSPFLATAGTTPTVALARVTGGSGAVGEPMRAYKHPAREPGDPETGPGRWLLGPR